MYSSLNALLICSIDATTNASSVDLDTSPPTKDAAKAVFIVVNAISVAYLFLGSSMYALSSGDCAKAFCTILPDVIAAITAASLTSPPRIKVEALAETTLFTESGKFLNSGDTFNKEVVDAATPSSAPRSKSCPMIADRVTPAATLPARLPAATTPAVGGPTIPPDKPAVTLLLT